MYDSIGGDGLTRAVWKHLDNAFGQRNITRGHHFRSGYVRVVLLVGDVVQVIREHRVGNVSARRYWRTIRWVHLGFGGCGRVL